MTLLLFLVIISLNLFAFFFGSVSPILPLGSQSAFIKVYLLPYFPPHKPFASFEGIKARTIMRF